ncbi:MAG: glycosyltransferase [Flavobacteriales bacterium]
MSKKILRIINRFNLGGPTYNAAYLSKYLKPEFDTLLVGGHKDNSEDSSKFILDDLDLSPKVISEMRRDINFANDRKAYLKLKRIIKAYKPDIVHTHASKAGAIGRRAAINMNVPVKVHTFHGHVFHSYFNKLKTGVFKRIEKYLASRSDQIIAISDKQKHELVEKHGICDESKVSVIPLGFDLKRFRNAMDKKRHIFRLKFNIKDDEIAIGIIGRLVPVKDHRLFLESLNKIKDRTDKKIRAFIIGDGEERSNLMEMADNLGLNYLEASKYNGFEYHSSQMNGKDNKNTSNPILTFTSWQKEIDVVNAGVDIIALTSKNEGTPVSLIEAQAANNPIVSTNVGGVENIVKPKKTALLSENGDSDKFAENLLELIENNELRKEMSKNGWYYVKDKYNVDRLVDDMSDLYNKLLHQYYKKNSPLLHQQVVDT